MSQAVLITREPVVNKQRAITANRLVVHAPSVPVAVAALNALSASWPSNHTVFVSLGRLVPTAELMDWQMPPNTMVEIPAPALAYEQTKALIPQLQEAGINVCLSWYQPGMALPDGAEFRFVLADANKTPKPVGFPGIAIATGLPDLPAFATAVQNGYDGASGWFFLKGVKAAKELAPSHAQIVRLLNLVRNEAEVKEIEAALKLDVALSYKLLRYINSPAFGLMVEVQSFRHAVTILGMDKLNKWLSLLLVSASKDPLAPALMQAAIARGRFMELIGAAFVEKREVDNLFITGAFSLIHVLLGTTPEAVLSEMTLPEPINDALLRGEGIYRPFLDLAIACERLDPALLGEQISKLQLRAEDVSKALVAAVAFADSLQFG
ncbi:MULTISPECIES: EAL and HDOD domain-containing protein [Niveibacterium]|uniref:HDOD domain-containing protein n=1 Tax=Niveibacterium microcysteis TaxID=2811415 RepID=A0ABX7M6X9_9RHOO|nr:MULTISPECIES: HDOD domain-containing protein [Niveibacterium]QSI77505.1 HDOD domain-containing protein [Niveibacterium microcysteis]